MMILLTNAYATFLELGKECNIVVHRNCRPNVPPMCGIPYNAFATVYEEETTKLTNLGPIRIHSRQRSHSVTHSTTSSYDLSWLEPLVFDYDFSKATNCTLPKFSDFKYICQLGYGYYAKVYCAQHIPSKQYVVIKVVDGTDTDARIQLEVEKQILFRYSHKNPYMVNGYCSFSHGTKLFIVMELVQGDTLYRKIQTKRMNEDEIKFYLAELICVLQYLHTNNIIYRDLKLEHIIISSDGNIRLIDYGLVKILKQSTNKCFSYCGTLSYMAPEVRAVAESQSPEGYSYPVDFWALGILMYEMLWGERYYFDCPHSGREDPTEVNIHPDVFELPVDTSAEAKRFIFGLLETDPQNRLGSPNSPHGPIRDHPFLKSGCPIDWQATEEGLLKSPHKNRQHTTQFTEQFESHRLQISALNNNHDAKNEWNSIEQSTCTAGQAEVFQSFNCINPLTWLDLTPL